MANVHAAIKQIRKDAKRRVRNQAVFSELKTLSKQLGALASQDRKQAEALARNLVSKWDCAVSQGVVPKGRADRKKAQIARLLAPRAQSTK